MLSLLGFCLLASACLLLRTELGPFLVTRPLLLGPLLGAVAGYAELGLLIAALLEWVWIDRIPAGGIRTPAVSIGVSSALAVAIWHGPQLSAFQLPVLTVAMAVLYTALFVPLDGGIRRLWNIASENVIAALERGTLTELYLVMPVALIGRWLAVAIGLATAPLLASMVIPITAAFVEAVNAGPAPMIWTIPAAVAALSLRVQRGFRPLGMLVAFLVGWLFVGVSL